jgi:hypothetical protein
MLIWGGENGQQLLGDGARYDPAAATWRPMSTTGAPKARTRHQAVWTGREMLVLGGGERVPGQGVVAESARYDPVADRWSPVPASALSSRGVGPTATWTDQDLLVTYSNAQSMRTGSRLDLTTGRWSLLGEAGEPSDSREFASAFWTGRLLLVWGGKSQKTNGVAGIGAAYDPLARTWRTLPPAPVFTGPAAWSGTTLYTWGGDPWNLFFTSNSGARFTPDGLNPPTPVRAPPVLHDERYAAETGFRVDDDAIWSFAQQLSDPEVLGQPLSRTFTLSGCRVQIFAERAVQACPGREVGLLNVLDSDILPLTQLGGGRTIPSVDDALKAQTPRGDLEALAAFVREQVPDDLDHVHLGFQRAYFAATESDGVALELWGAPLSAAVPEPGDPALVTQRFQRALLEYDGHTQTTRTFPIGEVFRDALRDAPEFAAEAREELARLGPNGQPNPYFDQYCPLVPASVCRPLELPRTDLSFAFEAG